MAVPADWGQPLPVELQNKLEVGRLTLLKALENQQRWWQELGRIERRTTKPLPIVPIPEKNDSFFVMSDNLTQTKVYTFLLRKRQ